MVGAGNMQEREGRWVEKPSQRESQDVEVETTRQEQCVTDGRPLEYDRERQRGTQRGQKSLAQRDGKRQTGRGVPGESPGYQIGGGYQIPVCEDSL